MIKQRLSQCSQAITFVCFELKLNVVQELEQYEDNANHIYYSKQQQDKIRINFSNSQSIQKDKKSFEFMEKHGVANPGCRDEGSTLNIKTGW